MISAPLASVTHTSGDTSVIVTHLNLLDYAIAAYDDNYTLCNPVISYNEATPDQIPNTLALYSIDESLGELKTQIAAIPEEPTVNLKFYATIKIETLQVC